MIYPLLRELEEEGYINGWWEEPQDPLEGIGLLTKVSNIIRSSGDRQRNPWIIHYI